ncbi:MAG: hypothetical protein PHW54_03260, partial [Candidatus Omnitrophica bacterium]|nr:hypothetical protein [Candidatus Omnitrophota bacterium]
IASKKEVFIKMVICESTTREDLTEGLKLIHDVNKSLVLVLQPDSCEKSRPKHDKLELFKVIAKDNHITACVIPQIHKKIGMK